eukprot:scaffold1144_cov215-Pinguiococcus_pyrenoidosus.AAC.4
MKIYLCADSCRFAHPYDTAGRSTQAAGFLNGTERERRFARLSRLSGLLVAASGLVRRRSEQRGEGQRVSSEDVAIAAASSTDFARDRKLQDGESAVCGALCAPLPLL